MVAKVDSALVQDGYQIYHHSFFFSKNGRWSVVQQGMNLENQTARRYHWYSDNITDIVCEPHSGIVSELRVPTLDLTAKESQQTRDLSTQFVHGSVNNLWKDIEILHKHSSELSKTITIKLDDREYTALTLANREFHHHPVVNEDFSQSKYLKRIFSKVCDVKPESYEKLLALEGVGPKTMRALSLVSEVIYGAKPSYEDPARYSFAHGGKDGTPYFVDTKTYDSTITFFSRVINKMSIPFQEKKLLLTKIARMSNF